MTDALLGALVGLRFNSAPTPDDVWKPSPFHVEELHKTVVDGIFEGVGAARRSDDSSPLGVVVRGQSGSGKTHMLGMVRERIHRETGYFFLVSLLNGKMFWESVAIATVEGLLHDGGGWGTQLTAFLRRLTSTIGLDADLRDAIAGARPLTPTDMNAFITALRHHSRDVGQEAQDTARSMVLYGSDDFEQQDIGYAYLTSSVEAGDPADRSRWGIGRGIRTPQLIVRDITRLLALTGPTVIAIDQLDTLFAQTIGGATGMLGDAADSAQSLILLGQVADGLMDLRQTARRTLTVVACLPVTWELIKRRAASPVPDRFRELSILHRIPTAEIGEAIIAKRLALHYADVGLTPAYPTWPILPAAFADAPDYTPRALLKRVERHVQSCVSSDRLSELANFDDGARADDGARSDHAGNSNDGGHSDDGARPGNATGTTAEPRTPAQQPVTDDRLAALDARFAELRAAADVTGAARTGTRRRADTWATRRRAPGLDHRERRGRRPLQDRPATGRETRSPCPAPARPRRGDRRRVALGIPGDREHQRGRGDQPDPERIDDVRHRSGLTGSEADPSTPIVLGVGTEDDRGGRRVHRRRRAYRDDQ